MRLHAFYCRNDLKCDIYMAASEGLYWNTSLCRADFTCSCGRSADHRNMFGEYESASDIVASGGSCTACRIFTIGTLMGRGYIVCRDTAVLKQYVIYLYGGAFILAIILWMGSKLNRYILNKLWISMLASLIMAGVIAQMLNQKYDHLMATGELIVGFLCAVIYLVAVSGTWTLANADWGKYNRYHAVYTSNKMINVFATIFNAAGYYSGKNWRR